MYQVLIADDEEIERNALKLMIENSIPQLQITGQAVNGIELLQLLRKNKYDIAIVDIEMPGLSGLAVLEMMQKELEDTRVIIFTAYSNFSYAQVSLRCRAFDYLLKPARRECIVETLQRCREDIERSREKTVSGERLKEVIRRIRPLMDEEIMYSFSTGNGDFSKLRMYLQVLGIPNETGYMMTFQIKDKRDVQLNPEQSLDQLDMKRDLELKIKNELNSIVEHAIIQTIHTKVVAFIPLGQKRTEYQNRMESIHLANIILERLKVSDSVNINIGIGSVQTDLEHMNVSYKESLKALYDIKTNIRIRHYNDLFEKGGEEWDVLRNEQKQLVDAILEKNHELQRKIVEKIFFKLRKDSLEEVCSHILELIVQIFKELDNCMVVDRDNRIQVSRLCRECMNNTDINELKEWLLASCEKLSGEMNSVNHVGQIIEKAQKYIQDYYYEDLSLNDVAEQCNVSIYYLSRLFKEKLGEKYSSYLTRIRMEEAMKMIKKYDYPMKTIAEKCGFNSAGYFCRVFKQYTGITVGEYREGKGI